MIHPGHPGHRVFLEIRLHVHVSMSMSIKRYRYPFNIPGILVTFRSPIPGTLLVLSMALLSHPRCFFL